MEERGKTALVVDHDLLFIDYLSQRLLVFDGVPAEKGEAKGPFEMQEGMKLFLEDLGINNDGPDDVTHIIHPIAGFR